MTAETAVALPILVLVTAALAWLVCLGVSQARVVDAARETARSLARGDAESVALDRGRRVAPDGARFRIGSGSGDVVVTVTADVVGPGSLLGGLPGFTATATAVAAEEGVP